MTTDDWGLPGPRRFLQGVLRDIEQGRSVMILSPPSARSDCPR